MGLTLENLLPVPYRIVGNVKEVSYSATFDNSYLEGGETFKPSEVNFSRFERVSVNIMNGSESETNPVDTGYYKEEKLHLIDGKTSKEMAKEKDMSKVIAQVNARGL